MRQSTRSQFSLSRFRTLTTPTTQGLTPVHENTTRSRYTVSRLSTDDSFCSVASSTFSPTTRRSSIGERFNNMTQSFSSHSLSSIRSKFAIRRSPSQIEIEQEEERLTCGDELLAVIEPRPSAPSAVGSFEDVLFGRL